MLEHLPEIGVRVLHLLLEIADGGRVTLIVHAHGARDLDVAADLDGVGVSVGLLDLRSQKEVLRRFLNGLYIGFLYHCLAGFGSCAAGHDSYQEQHSSQR